MKISSAHVAHALSELLPTLPQHQWNAAMDAALILLRRYGLQRTLRDFPTLVRQAVEEQQGVRTVQLAVGFGPPETSASLLRPAVERFLGQCRIAARSDERLLGGVQVRIGDDQIDASVRTLLDRLSSHLCHGSTSLPVDV